jgi:DNA gyrase subunit A
VIRSHRSFSTAVQADPMQTSFGVINLSIVNGQPRVLNLVETLNEFITFRREVVRIGHSMTSARQRLARIYWKDL